MSARALTLGTGGLVTLAIAVAAWFLLAPTQVGGRTSLAVVSGNSMEPLLHRGDLVVTRARDRYEKGDVVLYDSAALEAHVLHRIVDEEGGRFVTKGDHNDFLDADRPSPGQVRGKVWFTVGGAGSLLTRLREPLPLGVTAFVLVLLALGGGRHALQRRGEPSARPVAPAAGVRRRAEAGEFERGLLTAGLTALSLFCALAIAAWTMPVSAASAVSGAYAHTGELTYAARPGVSPVYPRGDVLTGDPVFTRLVKNVGVTFTYALEGIGARAKGDIAVDAVVSDGSGWSRALTLVPQTPFEGAESSVTGRLRLSELTGVTQRMRALTGSSTTSFTLTVRPVVRVDGSAGGASLGEEFRPEFPFVLDPVALRIQNTAAPGAAGAGAGAPPDAARLTVRREGAAPAVLPTRVGVGRFTIATGDARTLASTGIVLAGLISALAALLLARRRGGGEIERIAARYGSRIVRVDTVVPEGRWITDVPDIETLVQVADRYDRMILHSSDGASHVYLVDDGVAVYRLRAVAGAGATRRVSAAARA